MNEGLGEFMIVLWGKLQICPTVVRLVREKNFAGDDFIC
jgi:hypothetical protein